MNTVEYTSNDYLPLETVKKWLNIEDQFEADDLLIMGMTDAALEAVEKYLDRPLKDYEVDGKLPSGLKTCAMFLISTWYALRESVSQSNMQPIPHSFELMIALYKNYDYREAIYKNTSE